MYKLSIPGINALENSSMERRSEIRNIIRGRQEKSQKRLHKNYTTSTHLLHTPHSQHVSTRRNEFHIATSNHDRNPIP